MRYARLLLCLWIACCAASATVRAQAVPTDQWPTWRGDNDRHGSTLAVVHPAESAAWVHRSAAPITPTWSTEAGRVMEKLLLDNRIGYDLAIQPVVAGGKVYLGSSVDHQLQCRDLRSGQVLWSMVADAPIRLSPTYAHGKIYFGSDDGCAYCLDASHGNILWQHRAGPSDDRLLARGEMISRWPVRTGVLIDGDLAYFGAGIFPHERVWLYCVNAHSGEIVWVQDHLSELDAGRTGLSPQGYLMATSDQLFVPSGRSLPVALDKKNGQVQHARKHSWRNEAGGVVGGYRALLANNQLIASGDHHWLAMDQSTGNVGYGWFEGKELIIQGANAYSVTGTELIKMDLEQYAINSRRRQQLKMKYREVSRGAIAISDAAKQRVQEQLLAIQQELDSIADIGVPWRTPCTARSSLLATKELVFVGGPEQVTGYSTETGRQMWSAAVEGDATGLVAVDGYLLVSTDQGHVYTFAGVDLSVTSPSQQASNAGSTSEAIPELYEQAAEQILNLSGKQRGFCLVLDNGQGFLAQALAKRSQLKIYAVDRDAQAVQQARSRLHDAGYYGHRITVHHVDDQLPYSNYFADLIVSDAYVVSGKLPDYAAVSRHLKPVGGQIVLPVTASNQSTGVQSMLQRSSQWLLGLGISDQAQLKQTSTANLLQRGPLPGAGSWSHLYGNAANTAISNETRVQSELGVLWYGDPGPGEMVNRHEGAVGPLATGGRLFVQGESTISAYDAYNGTFLWRHENPKAIRTGVYMNNNPGNLAATEDRLFHFVRNECFELDAATGKILRVHRLPAAQDDGEHQWGYVAVSEGYLLGTCTLRDEVEEKFQRRGKVTKDATDKLFAIELESGLQAWEFQGNSVSHHTIAVGPGRVYFIDSSITSQQREEILAQDKTALAALTGAERDLAEDRVKRADIRRAIALDLKSGEQLWAQPVDVTDCSDLGIGGGKLTLMYYNGTLLLGGANANGHFWEQFVSGAFTRRRLVALSADEGYVRWKKDANYKGRPIIIGNQVLAEPWAFQLQSGDQITRAHPTTGQQVPWSLMRTGHHCGILTGCDSGLLMFRSGDTAFYDLNADAGTNHFSGHRLGCWINAIPANGLVMIPEASAGCVCQFSIAATIVLEPRPRTMHWTIHSAVGSLTPVQSMSVNFGSPGDRRDADGTLWLSYPRRNAYKETSLAVDVDLQAMITESGGYRSLSESRVQLTTTASNPSNSAVEVVPWIASSWVEGLQQLTLPLLGPEDAPAEYQVTLMLSSAADNDQPAPGSGSQVCMVDVTSAGQSLLSQQSIPVSPPETPYIVQATLAPQAVKDSLTLEFQSQTGKLRLHGLVVSRVTN
ncbi:MAG: PQQ-binding-like beta-propeller repeat protein [Pirellulaceae bacterium]|nr:PQQ-binding-like beta-propeller repeat protein [Pirellulaceae bacterium]